MLWVVGGDELVGGVVVKTGLLVVVQRCHIDRFGEGGNPFRYNLGTGPPWVSSSSQLASFLEAVMFEELGKR